MFLLNVNCFMSIFVQFWFTLVGEFEILAELRNIINDTVKKACYRMHLLLWDLSRHRCSPCGLRILYSICLEINIVSIFQPIFHITPRNSTIWDTLCLFCNDIIYVLFNTVNSVVTIELYVYLPRMYLCHQKLFSTKRYRTNFINYLFHKIRR